MAKVEIHGVFMDTELISVLFRPDGLIQAKHARTITGPNYIRFTDVLTDNYNPGDVVPDEIANYIKNFGIVTAAGTLTVGRLDNNPGSI